MIFLFLLSLALSEDLSCDIGLSSIDCDAYICHCNANQQEYTNIQKLVISGETSENTIVINNSDIIVIFSSIKIDLTGSELSPFLAVNSQVDLRFTGQNKIMQFKSKGPAIECANGSSLLLSSTSGTTADYLYVEGNGRGAGIGTGHWSGVCKKITVNSGKIDALTFGMGAGLGTGYHDEFGLNDSVNEIVINGGEIWGRGPLETGKMGAGIGVGYNGTVDSVTINGGKITAKGQSAAGIGGGFFGHIRTVVINGGNITSRSNSAAGIGAGYKPNFMESVIINDGIIDSIGYFGAAIGAGYYADLGEVVINKGKINAIAEDERFSYASGIGAGQSGNCNRISIKGGDIYAYGIWGAGIGAGESSNVDLIEITGGNITAYAWKGAGIGAGEGSNPNRSWVNHIKIDNGWINATGNESAGIGAGYGHNMNSSSVNQIEINGGTIFAYGISAAGIGGGYGWINMSANVHTITINGGKVYAEGLTGIGGSAVEFTTGCVNVIQITGGTIEAVGNYTGIGAGVRTVMDLIDISGGTLIATCTENGAGIGGGGNSTLKKLSISGGKITTLSLLAGAGIGIGSSLPEMLNKPASINEIVISGGFIFAKGSKGGAGIGAGDTMDYPDAYIDNIIISGGNVEAFGGEFAAGIGGGYESNVGSVIIKHNTEDSIYVYAEAGGYATDGIGKGYRGTVLNALNTEGGFFMCSANKRGCVFTLDSGATTPVGPTNIPATSEVTDSVTDTTSHTTNTPFSPTEEPTEKGFHLSTGAIIGIAAGTTAVVAAMVTAGIYIVYKMNRSTGYKKQSDQLGDEVFEN